MLPREPDFNIFEFKQGIETGDTLHGQIKMVKFKIISAN